MLLNKPNQTKPSTGPESKTTIEIVIFLWMYEMRFGYNLLYYDSSDYYPHLYLCLYNVSADVPSGLHQVFLFDLPGGHVA